VLGLLQIRGRLHAGIFRAADFAGRIVHPQKWPEDLDYAGKRVVVIGSGATAVTLVPEMAKTAGHVTMLQRSPTYVVARPAEDPLANKLRAICRQARLSHDPLAQRAVRHVFLPALPAQARAGQATDPRRRQDGARSGLRHRHAFHAALQSVGSAAVPGAGRRPVQGDQGKARLVVTNEIDTFTKNGIKLKDGSELEADIIVTATGLNLQVLGGLEVSVDGRTVDFARTLNYKGMMY
jgi:monooxygenase